jgi:RNA polymerase sigma factor (TIGR02999 family)
MSHTKDATHLLNLAATGDNHASARLLDLLYEELRALAAAQMARERTDHTLQPTALVHEAYLKLVDQAQVQWQGKSHFMALAATMMRRILVDHARIHKAAKRGGSERAEGRVSFEQAEAAIATFDTLNPGLDMEALDAALKELAALDERQAKVVDLRFFAGLDVIQAAEVLGVSERTVKNDWRFARAWLAERLAPTV